MSNAQAWWIVGELGVLALAALLGIARRIR